MSRHRAQPHQAGAEPHDLELTPRDVAELADADLVVYLSGFQPAVDDAVAEQASDVVSTWPAAADLRPRRRVDPHFWLDPTRLADVAGAARRPAGASSTRTTPRLPPQRGALRTDADGARRRLRDRPGPLRQHRPGHESHRLRLPGRAVRPHPGRHHRAAARGRAVPGRPRRGRRLRDGRTTCGRSTTRPWSARRSRRRWPARPASAPRCSTRSRGSTTPAPGRDYLAVMRGNLATLRDGPGVPMTADRPDRCSTCATASIGYGGPRRFCATSTSPCGSGEVVAVLGRQRLGQVHAGHGAPRLAQITARHARGLRHPGRAVPRVVAHRLRAPAPHASAGGCRRPCGEVVTSGRLARTRPWLRVRPRPTGPRSPRRSRPSGSPAASGTTVADALRRPAAPRADRPRPRRRTRACCVHRRADRRASTPRTRQPSPTRCRPGRRAATTSCWSPTSSGRPPR